MAAADLRLKRAAPLLALLLAAPTSAETLRVVAAETRLRAQPSSDAELVASLEKGSEVEVLETLGGWCRVRVAVASSEAHVGVEGYLQISDLEPLPRSAPEATPPEPQPAPPEPAPPEPEPAEPAPEPAAEEKPPAQEPAPAKPATAEPAAEAPETAEEPDREERPALRSNGLPAELSLDGVLSEPVWASTEAIANLTTVEPEEGGVPAGSTTVKVLANAKEIVVGVVCQDADPGGIVSFSKARDSDLEEEDHVLLVLDTFQDGRSGYVFAVNPSGARFDGLVIQQGEDVNSNWDAVWEARTSRNGDGWSAEIRIPIKSISFGKGLTSWGFNVQRRVQRLQETSRWSGANRDQEIFQTSHAGLLTELPRFDLGLGLSIRPALVGDMSKPEPDAERTYDGTPSLDAAKTLGPNALASLTVNTDFAETESDARQTNLTRFDLFFPEKRTFFLQGADIFDFGLGLDSATGDPGARADLIPFYSRRIGLLEEEGDFVEIPIDAGGKVNGRLGDTNVGALAVRTREKAEFGVPASTMGVLRLKQNVLEESSVGMIATFGDPRGRSGSWLAGADLTFQTSSLGGDKNFLVGAWGLRNERDDLEGDKYAYGGKIDFPNDIWDVSASYMHIGDAFDPSLGFVLRPGNIVEGGAEWRPRPGGDVIRQLAFGAKSYVVLDQERQWESYLVEAKALNVKFESGDEIEFLVEPQGERLVEPFEIEEDVVIPPGAYEWRRYSVVGALADKRRISGELAWSFGDFYDGTLDTVEATLLLKPSATFNLELGAEWNKVDLPEGSFREDVYSARLQINVSSDLQLSSLLQYDNQSRSFGTNTRLRWTFHPLGDVFVVYNHNLDRSLDDRWLFNSNQLLVKIQYAFRL
jgi:hypothetical protein